MTNLSSRAMLVSLSIKQWTARKYDKRETSQLAAHHGISNDIARVNKDLLPSAAELDAIEKKSNEIRTDYYARTLPWMPGIGIIKATAYMDFTALMRNHMDEWRRLVRQFVYVYPQLQADAQLKLNGLYRADDYPHPRAVADRFGIRINFQQVPDVNDWRVEIEGQELERLRQEVSDQMAETVGDAMAEAWKRVHAVVERIATTLADPKAVFRNTLVDNATELCALLPSLNLTDSPQLEATRQALERSIAGITPDDLRKDMDVRATVAGDMADIMSKMGHFFQAPGQ